MSSSVSPLRRWAVEFLVIAVGVFVGLGAESWAEERRERAEAHELPGMILADLQADSTAVAQAGEDLRSMADLVGPARTALIGDNLDVAGTWELIPRDGGKMNPKLRFRSGAYRTLLSSGRITALPPELAAGLSTLYEFEYGKVEDILGIVEVVVNEYFDRVDRVWNTATGEVRPDADLIGFANQLGKYRGVAGLYLMTGLSDLEEQIGETRQALIRYRGD